MSTELIIGPFNGHIRRKIIVSTNHHLKRALSHHPLSFKRLLFILAYSKFVRRSKYIIDFIATQLHVTNFEDTIL